MKTWKWKKVLSAALCLALLTTGFSAALPADASTPETFTQNGIQYQVLDATARTAEVIANSYSGAVDVPATASDSDSQTVYSVTAIGDGAFRNFSGLTSVALPDSVTSIGASAFQDSANLASVTMPNADTAVGTNAFYKCSALTSIDLTHVATMSDGVFEYSGLTSATVPSVITSLPDNTFMGCAGLASVLLPSNMTAIGQYAFDGTGLTSIALPSGIASIGSNAFQDSASLASITMPTVSTSIGQFAFDGCDALSQIDLSNVISLGTGAFQNSGLGSQDINYVQSIPSAITSLPAEAFYQCTALLHVSLPVTMTAIGENAFNDSALTDITLPDTVTEVDAGAFECDSNLQSVTFGKSLSTIGSNAFNSDNHLTSVAFTGQTAPSSVDSTSFSNCGRLAAVYVPDGTCAAYQTAMQSGGVSKDIVGYHIVCNQPAHGSLAAPGIASTSDAVTLTVKPDAGYTLGALTVSYSGGNAAVTENADGTYGFTMPDGGVTAAAVFRPLSNTKAITGFTVGGVAGKIDETGHTVAVMLPSGTDVTNLAPTVTISGNASVSPASGQAEDFTNPVDYTVTAEDGTTQSYTVTATVAVKVAGVSLNMASKALTVGGSVALAATATPGNATDRNVNWSSSNPSVATVDAAGVVTAVGVGTANITADTEDGGYTASCSVTVSAASSGGSGSGSSGSGSSGSGSGTTSSPVTVTGTSAANSDGTSTVTATIPAGDANAGSVSTVTVNLGGVSVQTPASVLSSALGGDSTASLTMTQSVSSSATQQSAFQLATAGGESPIAALDLNLARLAATGTSTAIHTLSGSVTVTVTLTSAQIAALSGGRPIFITTTRAFPPPSSRICTQPMTRQKARLLSPRPISALISSRQMRRRKHRIRPAFPMRRTCSVSVGRSLSPTERRRAPRARPCAWRPCRSN